MVQFSVPGDPVGKERPRRGRGGRFYTPAKTKRFEASVAYLFLASKDRAFSRRHPATKVAVMCHFRNKRHPDPDNVLKAVLDGLSGAAYANDANIESSVGFTVGNESPSTVITVEGELGVALCRLENPCRIFIQEIR